MTDRGPDGFALRLVHKRSDESSSRSPEGQRRRQRARNREPSRNMKFLLRLLPSTSVRAAADGMSEAIGVTTREVVVVKARWFRLPELQRYSLSSITHVELHCGASASWLDLHTREAQLVLLYWSHAAADFERVAACVRSNALGLQRRRFASRVALRGLALRVHGR